MDFSGAANGRSPYSTFVLNPNNGKFYGTTYIGGSYNAGVILEWDPTTDTYTNKVDLLSSEGAYPRGDALTFNPGDDIFYGTMTLGGDNNQGVIFEWDPNSNTYARKFNFVVGDGGQPYSPLVLNPASGKYYGTTRGGGANSRGVIFEWNPATDTYTKKFDFSASDGSTARSAMTLLNNKFYGVTYDGGANGQGVIFEWDPNTNAYTKKFDFNGAPSGSYPITSLVVNDGKLYGTTDGGGSNDMGVIFEWDPATDTYTKKVDFDGGSKGSYPESTLVFSGDSFYGMTYSGGANDLGVIFRWNPATNIFTKK